MCLKLRLNVSLTHIFLCHCRSFWNQICNSTNYIYFNLMIYKFTQQQIGDITDDITNDSFTVWNTVLTWKNVSPIPVKILYGTFPSDVQPLLWLVRPGFICGITVSCFTTGTFEISHVSAPKISPINTQSKNQQRNKEKKMAFTLAQRVSFII